ncbi:hypothetical protein [Aromatoleum diolicum]|uniref:hypothetical protein n=1 Tax=Aromatoleum diolicum TaxID=75796 RepID=UPI00145E90B2|nr:hypothetical protein [Aromatoleum diolicum]
MDKDYTFYQGRIREAQRLRDEALGELLAAGWTNTKHLVVRAYHAVLGLLHSHHPVHH